MFKKILVKGIVWKLPITDVIIEMPLSVISKTETNVHYAVQKYIGETLKTINPTFKTIESYETVVFSDNALFLSNKNETIYFENEHVFIQFMKMDACNKVQSNGDLEFGYPLDKPIRMVDDFISAYVHFRDNMDEFTTFSLLDIPSSMGLIVNKIDGEEYPLVQEGSFDTKKELKKYFPKSEQSHIHYSNNKSELFPLIKNARKFQKRIINEKKYFEAINESIAATLNDKEITSITDLFYHFDEKNNHLMRGFEGYYQGNNVIARVDFEELTMKINYIYDFDSKCIYEGALHTPSDPE